MGLATKAYIRGLGSTQTYPDGLERKEIWINKKDAIILPYQENLRIPIDLVIGDKMYSAGLRTTPDQEVVAICPDLRDDNHDKVSLAHALKRAGYSKNQKIVLEVDGSTVRINS